MRYALTIEGKRVRASRELKGDKLFCPACKGLVIPKTGNYKIHHFAHVKKDCGYFDYKGMSEWHTNWQNLFPEDQREVRFEEGGKVHIADVVNSNGIVIEFQNSPISAHDKESRDSFYDKIIWVVNAKDFIDNISFNTVRTVEYEVFCRKYFNYKLALKEYKIMANDYNYEDDYIYDYDYDGHSHKEYDKYGKPIKPYFNGCKYEKFMRFDWKWERKIWTKNTGSHVFLDTNKSHLYLIKSATTVIKVPGELFIKKYCL